MQSAAGACRRSIRRRCRAQHERRRAGVNVISRKSERGTRAQVKDASCSCAAIRIFSTLFIHATRAATMYKRVTTTRDADAASATAQSATTSRVAPARRVTHRVLQRHAAIHSETSATIRLYCTSSRSVGRSGELSTNARCGRPPSISARPASACGGGGAMANLRGKTKPALVDRRRV